MKVLVCSGVRKVDSRVYDRIEMAMEDALFESGIPFKKLNKVHVVDITTQKKLMFCWLIETKSVLKDDDIRPLIEHNLVVLPVIDYSIVGE